MNGDVAAFRFILRTLQHRAPHRSSSFLILAGSYGFYQIVAFEGDGRYGDGTFTMVQQEHIFSADPAAVKQTLRRLCRSEMDEATLSRLAAIVDRRAQASGAAPSLELMASIAAQYEQDHARIAALRADPAASEWQTVLAHMLSFVIGRAGYAPDSDELARLSRHVFAAIVRDLPLYAYDSSFEAWITVRTARHVVQFWRDQPGRDWP